MKLSELRQDFDALIANSELLDTLEEKNDEFEAFEEEEAAKKAKNFSVFLTAISERLVAVPPSLMKSIQESIIEAFCAYQNSSIRGWRSITGFDQIEGVNKDDVILKLDTLSRFSDFVKYKLSNDRSLPAFNAFIDKYLGHIRMIRGSLASNMNEIKSLWDKPLAETRISFEIMDADAHGYFPPTAITLIHREKTTKLIYKSRPGFVDYLVTELFRVINEKTGKYILPYYTQVTLKNGHLLSEFINGKPVSIMTNNPETGAGEAIEKLIQQPGEWMTVSERKISEFETKLLSHRIATLDYVAKQIGLTDLHGDNAIYNSDRNFVFPIDLEAFDDDKATGLYGHRRHESRLPSDLPKEEIDRIIQGYKLEIKATERRLVPVGTSTLSESVSQGFDATFNLLKNTLMERFEVDDSNLKTYVTQCVNRTEKLIPAFTLRQGKLSGTLPEGEKIIVATLKK